MLSALALKPVLDPGVRTPSVHWVTGGQRLDSAAPFIWASVVGPDLPAGMIVEEPGGSTQHDNGDQPDPREAAQVGLAVIIHGASGNPVDQEGAECEGRGERHREHRPGFQVGFHWGVSLRSQIGRANDDGTPTCCKDLMPLA